MGCSEIVEAYESFLSGGNPDHFLDCCLNYDFVGYEDDLLGLEGLYRVCSCAGRSVDMISNGSSGFATHYKFGPVPSLISGVENAMRGIRDSSELVRVKSSYPWYDTTRFASMRVDDGSRLVKLDLTSARSADFFGRFIPDGSTVEVTPQVCRAMEMHEGIVRQVNEGEGGLHMRRPRLPRFVPGLRQDDRLEDGLQLLYLSVWWQAFLADLVREGRH